MKNAGQTGSSLDRAPKREMSRFVEDTAKNDDGEDDGGGDIEVDLVDYLKTEKEVFSKVKTAVIKHRKFIREGVIPFAETIKALSSYKAEGYKPDPGTVVESVDSSLEWKACVVSHTFTIVDSDDEDEPVTVMSTVAQDSRLNHALRQGNDPDEVRPVQSAVLSVFGETPLYWMQQQVLLAEKQMRYERFHCFDFEEIDWNKWSKARFFRWVGQDRNPETGEWTSLKKSARDPLNRPFQKLFKQQDAGAKDALFDLATEPFEVMYNINNHWFEDFQENVSCYTYLSFLGHDWLTPLLTCALQIAFPVLLALSSSRSYRLRVDCDLDGPEELWVGECIDTKGTGGEDWAFYCTRRTNKDAWMGRIMILLVMVFYALHVIPNQIALFYSTVGDTEGTVSKLSSLRKFVHDQDEDTLLTKIGYRVDLIMNSMYHCLLYTLNIFMLYTYESVEDILLGSLAIEFVKDIDEGFTGTGWYDTDYRYLKAGAMEMVIRKYVDFHELDRLLDKPFLVDGSPVNPALTPASPAAAAAAAAASSSGFKVLPAANDGGSAVAADGDPNQGLLRHQSTAGAGVSSSFRVRSAAALSNSSGASDTKEGGEASAVGSSAGGKAQAVKEEEEEEEEVDPLEDAAASLEAIEYTTRPKHHFYSVVNFLRGLEDRAKLARDAARYRGEGAGGGGSWLCGFCCCVSSLTAAAASFLRWLMPFSESEKPIFEKFDLYVDGALREKQWERLVYAPETAKESFTGFEFLSVEKTKERHTRAQSVASQTDWDALLSSVDDRPEERRILKAYKKRTTYISPSTSPFVQGIARVLLFADLPKQLRQAVDFRKPTATVGKVLFYVGFGVLNWITVMVQLCFPIVFVILLVFIPMCY